MQEPQGEQCCSAHPVVATSELPASYKRGREMQRKTLQHSKTPNCSFKATAGHLQGRTPWNQGTSPLSCTVEKPSCSVSSSGYTASPKRQIYWKESTRALREEVWKPWHARKAWMTYCRAEKLHGFEKGGWGLVVGQVGSTVTNTSEAGTKRNRKIVT